MAQVELDPDSGIIADRWPAWVALASVPILLSTGSLSEWAELAFALSAVFFAPLLLLSTTRRTPLRVGLVATLGLLVAGVSSVMSVQESAGLALLGAMIFFFWLGPLAVTSWVFYVWPPEEESGAEQREGGQAE